ncbi:MAG TPA: hypothetical protein VEQ42_07940 [Pyrinomonadaceae bacterium]|nr:hypothetical protein [Pyrinomonadaceae bacterium]
MKRHAFGAAVALVAFAAGVGCAALTGRAVAPSFEVAEGAARSFGAALAGVACFALAASSERARRRGAESDVGYSLVLLCLGFFLTGAGLGLFLRALIFD